MDACLQRSKGRSKDCTGRMPLNASTLDCNTTFIIGNLVLLWGVGMNYLSATNVNATNNNADQGPASVDVTFMFRCSSLRATRSSSTRSCWTTSISPSWTSTAAKNSKNAPLLSFSSASRSSTAQNYVVPLWSTKHFRVRWSCNTYNIHFLRGSVNKHHWYLALYLM